MVHLNRQLLYADGLRSWKLVEKLGFSARTSLDAIGFIS